MLGRVNQQPDEHPRPHVDVPMSMFGDVAFNGPDQYERIAWLIHLWCHAVWKRQPVVRLSWFDKYPDAVERLLRSGYLIDLGDGKVRHCGPHKDPHWLAEEARKRSWITYAIEAVGQGRVKIGRTTDLDKRLESLRCGSSVPLNVLGKRGGDHESRIHKLLRKHRIKGEWFHLNEPSRAVLGKERLL